jgi:hypothetical protein
MFSQLPLYMLNFYLVQDQRMLCTAQVFRSTIIPLAQTAGLFEEISLDTRFDNEGLERAEAEWRSWSFLEARRRVAFTFVAMDCAFSAIFLNSPCITVDSIKCIFPESDRSFQASNFIEWHASRSGTRLALPLCSAVEKLVMGTGSIPAECLDSLLGRTSLLSGLFSSIIGVRHSFPDFENADSPGHERFLGFKAGLVRCWNLVNLPFSPAASLRSLQVNWHWACLHLLVSSDPQLGRQSNY